MLTLQHKSSRGLNRAWGGGWRWEPQGRGAHTHAYNWVHAGSLAGCAGGWGSVPAWHSWGNSLCVNLPYQHRVTPHIKNREDALRPHSRLHPGLRQDSSKSPGAKLRGAERLRGHLSWGHIPGRVQGQEMPEGGAVKDILCGREESGR